MGSLNSGHCQDNLEDIAQKDPMHERKLRCIAFYLIWKEDSHTFKTTELANGSRSASKTDACPLEFFHIWSLLKCPLELAGQS